MKCENCGKNEVTFVYRSNVNGQVEEKHLCGACAEKLGYTKRLAESRAMMRNFFGNDPFFGGLSPFGRTALTDGSLFGEDAPAPRENGLCGFRDGFFPYGWMRRMLDNPFDDFFADMPALSCACGETAAETEAGSEAGSGSDGETQPEENRFQRWRKLNALKAEMKKAVHREDFERAAEIRDEIRRMEGKASPHPQGDASRPNSDMEGGAAL